LFCYNNYKINMDLQRALSGSVTTAYDFSAGGNNVIAVGIQVS